MHSFAPAVLLWLAWLDALDADAQPHSPHEEPGQAEDPAGTGERTAVVGADGLR